MKLLRCLPFLLFIPLQHQAQDPGPAVRKAFTNLLSDPQLANASLSLYVVDGNSGAVVFDHNSRVGLAPASTLKVITSVTAMELLGPAFRFRTDFGYTGTVSNGKLNGDIIIRGSGDPTLGSWRYPGNTEAAVKARLVQSLETAGVREIQGSVFGDDHAFESATTPGGWIWDDLGNYYGAGASALNWRENQYDLYFKPADKIGGRPEIIRTTPALYQVSLVNELTTAAKGTGDQSYIFLPPYSAVGYLRGSIPMESNFRVSGSFPDPALQTAAVFTEALKTAGYNPGIPDSYHNFSGDKSKSTAPFNLLFTQYSPALDSIIYWFNRKSINLYGEALLKKMGAVGESIGTTENGIRQLKDFWKSKGITDAELEIADGSGLSPQDRVTTRAQVNVLTYALTRPWYKSFLDALPEYNNMKMKSGTIRKVKGFAGYQRSAAGKTYVFSFIINNYSGSTSAVVNRMYKILDQLK